MYICALILNILTCNKADAFCYLQCEPGLGASVMYNLLYNPPQKLLLLAGCSTVCTTVAEAAKMWNLMVVSTSSFLNFMAGYRLLIRPIGTGLVSE